jgi:hypothetical protein
MMLASNVAPFREMVGMSTWRHHYTKGSATHCIGSVNGVLLRSAFAPQRWGDWERWIRTM